MAFKNILNLIRRNNKQKERFAGILGKHENEATSRGVPILDDVFTETSTGVFAQVKKYSFLNIAEFLETQRTSLNKNTVFIVEILDNVVNAAIISRKGVFLDVSFLKSYAYEELKDIYYKIVPDSKETSQEISNSIENIVSIVAYDVVYTLPKKIVIIENTHSDFKEISIRTGRFIDEKNAKEQMMRDLLMETGLSEDEIIYSAIKKPYKKNDKEIGFLVSFIEKDYYDSVDSYVDEAGFNLKKIHSIKSSLYASFTLKDRTSIMRIHVQDNIAYSLLKIVDEDYEYYIYDIKEEYEALELTAQQMEEVVLSGYGDYYEMLKSSFLTTDVNVRWWNYGYDLNRCIIRVEEGYKLDNKYANLLSTSYYELFNIRLALIRLGVGTKLSLYEFVAVNLSIVPIMIIVFTLFGMTGLYYYEYTKLMTLEKSNISYSKYFKEKKSLNGQLSKHKSMIKRTENQISKINKIKNDKVDIQDAYILYEIAQKLPNDMILIEVKKSHINVKNNSQSNIITIKGKCYLERSLLNYIQTLSFKDRKVYLVEMKDSKKTRLESNKEANIRQMSEYTKELENKTQNPNNISQQNRYQNELKVLEKLLNSTGTSVEYADTLNNSFTLEIR